MTRLEIALAAGVIAAMTSVPIPARAGQHKEAAPAHEAAAPATKAATSSHEASKPAPAHAEAKPAAEPAAAAKAEKVAQATAGEKKAEPAPAKKEATAAAAKDAKAETKPPATEARTASTKRAADAPRVSVTKVDAKTGMAEGPAKPAPASKLEEALTRINERIEDVRADTVRRQSRAAGATAPRIRLSWRTSLEWPEELVGAADAARPADAADDGRVSLVWK